jgi:hypothetical protein
MRFVKVEGCVVDEEVLRYDIGATHIKRILLHWSISVSKLQLQRYDFKLLTLTG